MSCGSVLMIEKKIAAIWSGFCFGDFLTGIMDAGETWIFWGFSYSREN